MYQLQVNISGNVDDIKEFLTKYHNDANEELTLFLFDDIDELIIDDDEINYSFNYSENDNIDIIRNFHLEFPKLNIDVHCENIEDNIIYKYSYNDGIIEDVIHSYDEYYYEENNGNYLFEQICQILDKINDWDIYLEDNSENIDIQQFADDLQNNKLINLVSSSIDFLTIINDKLYKKYIK